MLLREKDYGIDEKGKLVQIIQHDLYDEYVYLVVDIMSQNLHWYNVSQVRELTPLEKVLYGF